MNVLLFDPAARLAPLLRAWAGAHGHRLVLARSEATLLAQAGRRRHDAVLVDAVDCRLVVDATRRVRQVRERLDRAAPGWVPVVVVPATADERERIALLDAGADQCVATPLEPDELRARMQVCARRRAGDAEPPLRRGALAYHPRRGDLSCGGEPLALTRSEVALMACLLARDGGWVDKHELAEALRLQGFAPSAASIPVHLARLRRKLPPDHVRIRTARMLGYRLA